MYRNRRLTARNERIASTPRQRSPVRAAVPTGISAQAKHSATANSLTRQSLGKIVPCFASHAISGNAEIATQEMIEPS